MFIEKQSQSFFLKLNFDGPLQPCNMLLVEKELVNNSTLPVFTGQHIKNMDQGIDLATSGVGAEWSKNK
jgi:hypothetical protein